jgi:hypothetical protein
LNSKWAERIEKKNKKDQRIKNNIPSSPPFIFAVTFFVLLSNSNIGSVFTVFTRMPCGKLPERIG